MLSMKNLVDSNKRKPSSFIAIDNREKSRDRVSSLKNPVVSDK